MTEVKMILEVMIIKVNSIVSHFGKHAYVRIDTTLASVC